MAGVEQSQHPEHGPCLRRGKRSHRSHHLSTAADGLNKAVVSIVAVVAGTNHLLRMELLWEAFHMHLLCHVVCNHMLISTKMKLINIFI